jgi:hypothetical protein
MKQERLGGMLNDLKTIGFFKSATSALPLGLAERAVMI